MIYAITNQKGGIGKSTTAHALAAYFAQVGFNTLMADLDPQANLTQATGIRHNTQTTYNLLMGNAKIEKVVQKVANKLYILPASKQLSRVTAELTETGKEYKLKEALQRVQHTRNTDSTWQIIIDTPPSLSVLTVNALTAADYIIIPAQADVFSLEAVRDLKDTIQAIKKYTNPKIKVAGILLTRFNRRSIISRDMAEMLAEAAMELNTKVFSATIRECIAIKEAQAKKQDIFTYAPKSNASKDYNDFIRELVS